MNTTAKIKQEIIRDLSLLPESQMNQVRLYVRSILKETGDFPVVRSKQSLKGIWQDQGVERIRNLDAEGKGHKSSA